MKSCKKSPPVAPVLGAAMLALVLQTAAPAALAQRNAPPVTLNFVNAEIDGVARAMGTILNRQFIVDPRVKGQITLYSEQPMHPGEAYRSFLAALRGLGFAVVESGGLFKIVPEAEAKLQTDSVGVGSAVSTVPTRGDQIATQIFRLNHENANNLVTVLRPLISPNNTINVNPGNNSLVITDYADNLRRLARIIAALDLPASTGIEIFPLQHAVASDIAPLVQRLTSDQPGAAVAGAAAQAAAAGSTQVLADVRSNALIVRAANPQRLQIVRSIIEKLDRAPQSGPGSTGNIFVVPLRNADATRLAQTLRAAFSGEAQGGGGTGGGTGLGGTGGTTRTSTAATGTTTTATGGTGTTGGLSSGPSNFGANLGAAEAATGGFVQADPSTNSLIITAPEPMYRQVRAVIDQLDSRRAQVYVESLIVEVNANKAAELGVQWQGIIGNSGDTNIIGIGTNFGTGSNNILGLTQAIAGGASGLANAGLPGAGLNIGLAHRFGSNYTLGVLARALENNGDVNILSTPNLITLDNEEAKIVVGQNVPFITGQYTNTGTGTTSPFQTIERRDVGLTLRLKPQIGEGGTVRMTIFQESSAVQDVATGTANAGPTTSKRSIESTVVVDDGQILVLGGLIEDQFTTNRSKVPVLGDIPVLGGLFRSESRTRNKTNLMVFLRPVVMRTAQDASTLTLDRYDLIRALQQDQQPRQSRLLPINESPVLPSVHPINPLQAAPLGLPGPAQAPMQPSGPLPGQAPAPSQLPPAQPAPLPPPGQPQPVVPQSGAAPVPLPPQSTPPAPQS